MRYVALALAAHALACHPPPTHGVEAGTVAPPALRALASVPAPGASAEPTADVDASDAGDAGDAPAPPKAPEARASSAPFDFALSFPGGCVAATHEATCSGAATLSVRKRGSADELQRIGVPRAILWVSERDGQASGAPADDGAPGALRVGDFDFDGLEDVAIWAGNQGPYGGPTFSIYLQNKSARFVRSARLSALTENTLGMFQVDAARRRILTVTKSGCCWHQFDAYAWQGGVPVLVLRRTEDATSGAELVETTEQWTDGGVRLKTRHLPIPNDATR